MKNKFNFSGMLIIVGVTFFLGIVLPACEDRQQVPLPVAPQEETVKLKTQPVPKQLTPQEIWELKWPRASKEKLIPAKDRFATNFLVLLDISGSMDESDCSGEPYDTKLEAAKVVLKKFAETIVPKEANLGLMTFEGHNIVLRVPLGVDNRDLFVSRLNELKTGGGTPLSKAIADGHNEIERQARQQGGTGKYILVVVGDGDPSGGYEPDKIVDWICKNTPVQIHTIGFCLDENHALNVPGRVVYKPADSPDKLAEGLKSVVSAEAASFDTGDFELITK